MKTVWGIDEWGEDVWGVAPDTRGWPCTTIGDDFTIYQYSCVAVQLPTAEHKPPWTLIHPKSLLFARVRTRNKTSLG